MFDKLTNDIFIFLEKRRWWAAFAFGLVAAAVLSAVFLWQDELHNFINAPTQKRFFEVLAILLGPPVTAVGFYLGWRAKREMAAHSKRTLSEFKSYTEEQGEIAKKQAREIARREEQLAYATERLGKQTLELAAKDAELKAKEATIAFQNAKLAQLAEGSTELWRDRDGHPFPQYREWFLEPRAPRIITVANLKGGVGKSMVSSMLAAYVSETLGKPVLLVDLDFQGSVSTIMLLGDKRDEVDSRAENLLKTTSDGKAVIDENRIHLSSRLNRCWLIPANYTFAEAENRLLFQYVMQAEGEDDARFRLAKLLLDPRMASDYAAVIIDTPPRLSLGTVNALVASHGLVVPTILDKLSKEAVHRFLGQAETLKGKLNLGVRFLGVVGTMSQYQPPQGTAAQLWEELGESLAQVWGERADFRLGVLPRRSYIANAVGDDIPYFSTRNGDDSARGHFDVIGQRIFDRLRTSGELVDMRLPQS